MPKETETMIMRMRYLIFSLLIIAVFILGCTSNGDKQLAEEKCIELCKQTTLNLSLGPCLSNEVISDWVCDVAHSPRQAVDDITENQCSAFGKTAHHFVEVDENCSLIRSI